MVLAGEGTGAAYLAGVMRALDAAGVRIDVVLGRGAGALVAAFSAFCAEDKIDGERGLLEAVARRRPFRIATLYRFAVLCLATSFAFFAAPVLLGLLAVVVLPIQALLRGVLPEQAASPAWGSGLVEAVEPYYLPAVALPVIVLFAGFCLRSFRILWRRRARRPGLSDLFPPPIDLGPLREQVASRLWQLVRGTATEERPRDRRALSEAYSQLLASGLGQQGFRELVLYALDTDSGEEVPFALVKDRFAKKIAAESGPGRSEPVDLSGEGASVLFDALIAALTPPGLVPEVGIRLPRGTKFGGEVHRFASSLFIGAYALSDAVALGAEQIFYVTSAAVGSRVSGTLWERMSAGALRSSLERDLHWASEKSNVPVFVIRPESERLAPFEIEGRPQLGGGRLSASALVDQGARDVERLFVRPVLGEEISSLPREATVPVDREWEAGPKEL